MADSANVQERGTKRPRVSSQQEEDERLARELIRSERRMKITESAMVQTPSADPTMRVSPQTVGPSAQGTWVLQQYGGGGSGDDGSATLGSWSAVGGVQPDAFNDAPAGADFEEESEDDNDRQGDENDEDAQDDDQPGQPDDADSDDDGAVHILGPVVIPTPSADRNPNGLFFTSLDQARPVWNLMRRDDLAKKVDKTDDWRAVAKDKPRYVKMICTALQHNGYKDAPTHRRGLGPNKKKAMLALSDAEKANYRRFQKDRFEIVNGILKCPSEDRNIEFRAWEVVEEMLMLHQHGVKNTSQTKDRSTICSQRFEDAVKTLRDFPGVRKKILDGEKISDFCAGPEAFGKACIRNLNSNYKRPGGGKDRPEKVGTKSAVAKDGFGAPVNRRMTRAQKSEKRKADAAASKQQASTVSPSGSRATARMSSARESSLAHSTAESNVPVENEGEAGDLRKYDMDEPEIDPAESIGPFGDDDQQQHGIPVNDGMDLSSFNHPSYNEPVMRDPYGQSSMGYQPMPSFTQTIPPNSFDQYTHAPQRYPSPHAYGSGLPSEQYGSYGEMMGNLPYPTFSSHAQQGGFGHGSSLVSPQQYWAGTGQQPSYQPMPQQTMMGQPSAGEGAEEGLSGRFRDGEGKRRRTRE